MHFAVLDEDKRSSKQAAGAGTAAAAAAAGEAAGGKRYRLRAAKTFAIPPALRGGGGGGGGGGGDGDDDDDDGLTGVVSSVGRAPVAGGVDDVFDEDVADQAVFSCAVLLDDDDLAASVPLGALGISTIASSLPSSPKSPAPATTLPLFAEGAASLSRAAGAALAADRAAAAAAL